MKRDEVESSFAASILLEGCKTDASAEQENLWEERIVLVQAVSSSEAHAKAAEWGVRQEHGYAAMSGASVQWRFRRVTSVYHVIADKSGRRYGSLLTLPALV